MDNHLVAGLERQPVHPTVLVIFGVTGDLARRKLLPDGGAICETTPPPFQQAGDGHQILCHIPLETLQTLDPVVQMAHAQ